ncbi:hypothetical protein Tco_1009203 [Tanacetum coccineum]
MFQDFRYSDTTHLSRSVEVLKLKNFKKDATLKLFKNGMSMSVQKSQVHKMAKFQDGKEIITSILQGTTADDLFPLFDKYGKVVDISFLKTEAWMITEEMKLTEHYKMYAEVFGLDVPQTQSQPTESTQRTHRTTSAPRSPNPATEPADANKKKTDEMILQDTIQVSLAEHKSHEEQEARENVALVYEHLVAEEIEKLVKNPENVDDSTPPRYDDTSIPDTRLEPMSDKESPEVEIV